MYFWFLYCGDDDSGLSVYVVLMTKQVGAIGRACIFGSGVGYPGE
jgi:hypothetical protein